ncbi:hypothetical protein SELMODRAFT_432493, partial [Selaginella moellendorffii]
PEELLGTALDNDPKRLKVPAYYNEVVFVSPFAKLCWMISENRLDAFQTYAGKKIAGIHLRRDVHLEQACDARNTPFSSRQPQLNGRQLPTPGGNLTFLVMFLLQEKDIARLSSVTTCSCLGDVGNPAIPQRSNTFVWKKISTTGVSPIPQDSHTCSFYKNCFVVMGGEDGGNAYLNDVYILDTETMAWREVKTTGAELMLRARHTTISHGKYLVVFGGFSYDHKLFNDVHTLDLKMLRGKDPSEPKLSMRKELKRRRQEYCATPFVLDKQRDADKSLVSSHGEFQAHVQLLGEKMFEARTSTYGSTLIRKSSIQLGEIWSISIHVHTLWDGKSNLQTCQASNLHCRPLIRYYRSLEDMHSFYDHGPNVENSSIIKKSCSLAFNLSHFWHKTISNTMHQELAGNYDLQSFQEGQKDAECSSLEGFPGLKGDATLLVVGIRVCNQTTYSMFAKSIIALD